MLLVNAYTLLRAPIIPWSSEVSIRLICVWNWKKGIFHLCNTLLKSIQNRVPLSVEEQKKKELFLKVQRIKLSFVIYIFRAWNFAGKLAAFEGGCGFRRELGFCFQKCSYLVVLITLLFRQVIKNWSFLNYCSFYQELSGFLLNLVLQSSIAFFHVNPSILCMIAVFYYVLQIRYLYIPLFPFPLIMKTVVFTEANESLPSPNSIKV